MDHTVKNKRFPGVFEATPLRAPVRPWGHAPRQANPVLTQGRRGAQGRDTPPYRSDSGSIKTRMAGQGVDLALQHREALLVLGSEKPLS